MRLRLNMPKKSGSIFGQLTQVFVSINSQQINVSDQLGQVSVQVQKLISEFS